MKNNSLQRFGFHIQAFAVSIWLFVKYKYLAVTVAKIQRHMDPRVRLVIKSGDTILRVSASKKKEG